MKSPDIRHVQRIAKNFLIVGGVSHFPVMISAICEPGFREEDLLIAIPIPLHDPVCCIIEISPQRVGFLNVHEQFIIGNVSGREYVGMPCDQVEIVICIV